MIFIRIVVFSYQMQFGQNENKPSFFSSSSGFFFFFCLEIPNLVSIYLMRTISSGLVLLLEVKL